MVIALFHAVVAFPSSLWRRVKSSTEVILKPLATCTVTVTELASQVSPQLSLVPEVVTLSKTGPCGVGWIREVAVGRTLVTKEITVPVGAVAVDVNVGMRRTVGVNSTGVFEGTGVEEGTGVSVGTSVGGGRVSVGCDTAGTKRVGVAGINDGVAHARAREPKIERIR